MIISLNTWLNVSTKQVKTRVVSKIVRFKDFVVRNRKSHDKTARVGRSGSVK